MKTPLHLIMLLLLGAVTSSAQDFIQISTGTDYTNQAFYNLASKASIEVDNANWDLIFTTFGLQDAGIHVNEASSTIFGLPAPSVELYLTDAAELSEVTAFDSAYTRVYNDENSWAYGAGNVTRAVNNPFDYGWGAYDPASRTVLGSKIYVIKLRDESYKKLKIESLVLTTYNITYANLDGSEETKITINKDDYPNGLAFFSFAQGAVVDLGFDQFDFVFTRYITPLEDPDTGDTLDYTVTGILSGPGLEVAKVIEVDPATITPETAPTTFDTNLDAIGYDWKTFDFEGGWIIEDSIAYVVKTPGNKLYKLVFIDFEGVTTGVATFEQTTLDIVSNVNDENSLFEDFSVYPNPTSVNLNITYSLKETPNQINFRLFNTLGQQVWSSQADGFKGLNAVQVQLPTLPGGQYALVIQADRSVITKAVIIE